MIEGDVSSAQTGPAPNDSSHEQIVIIGRRIRVQGSTPQQHGNPLSIAVKSGGTNNPDIGLVEFFRGIFVDRTDYDLDEAFTDKQKEIMLKSLQGLADHPRFAQAMADLAEKGADINIVADFTGRYTLGDRARISGLNKDRSVDRGESITIYIDMNFKGEVTGNVAFAIALMHELLHSLGVSSLNTELDADGSTLDSDVTKDIFKDYDYYAVSTKPNGLEVAYIPSSGGSWAGTIGYDVLSGSNSSDLIMPGAGGSLIYSGDGDDRFVLTFDGDVDEIIDSQGLDTIELPAGTHLSAVTTRWSSDGTTLVVMIDGQEEALVLNAASVGAIEQISIDGIVYATEYFDTSDNVAPDGGTIHTSVYDAFFGGWVASGAVGDADGDTLSYRLGSVTGDYTDAVWTVDATSGSIFSNVARPSDHGSKSTSVTLLVSDGLDLSEVDVIIRWANSEEPDVLPPPVASRPSDYGQVFAEPMYTVDLLPLSVSDWGVIHG